jgi:hypothetical protein
MQFCGQIVAFRRNILPPASLSPEDGGILFLLSIDMCPQNYMVLTQRTTILIIIAMKISKACNISLLGFAQANVCLRICSFDISLNNIIFKHPVALKITQVFFRL